MVARMRTGSLLVVASTLRCCCCFFAGGHLWVAYEVDQRVTERVVVLSVWSIAVEMRKSCRGCCYFRERHYWRRERDVGKRTVANRNWLG